MNIELFVPRLVWIGSPGFSLGIQIENCGKDELSIYCTMYLISNHVLILNEIYIPRHLFTCIRKLHSNIFFEIFLDLYLNICQI